MAHDRISVEVFTRQSEEDVEGDCWQRIEFSSWHTVYRYIVKRAYFRLSRKSSAWVVPLSQNLKVNNHQLAQQDRSHLAGDPTRIALEAWFERDCLVTSASRNHVGYLDKRRGIGHCPSGESEYYPIRRIL